MLESKLTAITTTTNNNNNNIKYVQGNKGGKIERAEKLRPGKLNK